MTTETGSSFAVIKHNLARLLPIRVVIKYVDGKIFGLVENSFSMSESEKLVNVFWSGKATSILGESVIDGIAWANENAGDGYVVIDPLADDSPIEIDWEKWVNATCKFDKRNAPFTMKEVK